jgi:aminopeptidase-like protein
VSRPPRYAVRRLRFCPAKAIRRFFFPPMSVIPRWQTMSSSGATVTTYLAKWLWTLPRRKYTYRIVFIPETIGSITYVSRNLDWMKSHVVAGFNISCVGDDRAHSYLPSRNGAALSDKVAQHVLKWMCPHYDSYIWTDRGSDERQYCSLESTCQSRP